MKQLSTLSSPNDGGGGGPTEVHILYPKKSQLQNLYNTLFDLFYKNLFEKIMRLKNAQSLRTF